MSASYCSTAFKLGASFASSVVISSIFFLNSSAHPLPRPSRMKRGSFAQQTSQYVAAVCPEATQPTVYHFGSGLRTFELGALSVGERLSQMPGHLRVVHDHRLRPIACTPRSALCSHERCCESITVHVHRIRVVSALCKRKTPPPLVRASSSQRGSRPRTR